MRNIEEIIKANPDVDIVEFLEEIARWDDSLDGDVFDGIVHSTLESIVDMIAQYC